MRHSFLWLTLLIILGLSTACSKTISPTDVAKNPDIDQLVSTLADPASGKATVVGQVFDKESNKPITATSIRLGEVYRQGGEGAYVLDTAFSPGAYTDDKGMFVMSDIQPGEYVVIIGDVNDVYVIIPDENNHPKTFTAIKGEIVNFGQFSVTLGSKPVTQ
jgi:hypothetical protein